MKIKDDTEPYYIVDFCRNKECQQIRVVDTTPTEIKDFFNGIFSDKKKRGNASVRCGTRLMVRMVNNQENKIIRIVSFPLFNISPSQARIYTQKCIQYYFQNG